MIAIYRFLFSLISLIGRKFGGIPPRRVAHWLAQKGYNDVKKKPVDDRWYRDNWGNLFLLNPAHHIDRYIIAFGCYDPPLHKFIESYVKSGMTCFDIGANTGTISIHMAEKVGSTGKVYLFEPVPHIFDRLILHVNKNNKDDVCIANRIALADRSGSCVIAVDDEQAENQGLSSLVHHDHPNLTYQIEIQSETIDDFVMNRGITIVDFMKIDIQGGEVLLLKGGRRFFAQENAPDLMIEISPSDLRSIDLNSRDLLYMLEEYDYEIFNVTSNGTIGKKIFSDKVSEYFSAPNVFCTKKLVAFVT